MESWEPSDLWGIEDWLVHQHRNAILGSLAIDDRGCKGLLELGTGLWGTFCRPKRQTDKRACDCRNAMPGTQSIVL